MKKILKVGSFVSVLVSWDSFPESVSRYLR